MYFRMEHEVMPKSCLSSLHVIVLENRHFKVALFLLYSCIPEMTTVIKLSGYDNHYGSGVIEVMMAMVAISARTTHGK